MLQIKCKVEPMSFLDKNDPDQTGKYVSVWSVAGSKDVNTSLGADRFHNTAFLC